MTKKEIQHILKLTIFLAVLGLICTTILSVVNYITKDAIANNQLIQEEKETQVIVEKLENINVSNIENITSYNTNNLINDSKSKVLQIFKGLKEEKNILAFKMYSKNDFVEFNTLVVLKEDNNNYVVEDVIVLSNPTSFGDSANKKFFNNNFNLKNSSKDEINNTFEIVAGTTYSSKSVRQAVSNAMEQISKGVKTNEEN